MSLNNWEFSYNGLTFGGSNVIGLTSIEGLDMPDTKVDQIDKAEDHGSWVYAPYAQARTITLSGDVTADPSTFESVINFLRQAFTPQPADLPLSFNIPGDIVKRVNCVPLKRNFAVDSLYSIGYGLWSVQLLAGDPKIYSDSLTNLDVSPLTAYGVTFPIVFSVNFGGSSGGYGTLTNIGTASTYPTAAIHGPIIDPVLINQTTGKGLYFSVTMSAADRLYLDFQNRVIQLNGVNAYSLLIPGSSAWWNLLPGANSVAFRNSGGASGVTKVTFSWRSAWL